MDELSCRVYITDAIKAIADNTSRNGGVTMKDRYSEIIVPKKTTPEDPRSCIEIASDIWNRINRKEVR